MCPIFLMSDVILAIEAKSVGGNDLIDSELPAYQIGYDRVLPPQLKDLEEAIANCKEAFNAEMASLNLQVSSPRSVGVGDR